MQGGGFHPRNPVDFTLKSGGFQPWNLVDFTQISPVKSTQNYKSKCFSKNSSVWWMQGGGFHPEIWWIFTHEIWQISPRFHLWNPPKIIKASVSAKTSVDECRGGGFHPRNPVDFTLKSGGFQPWNLVDFTQISPVKSSQNYKSKCFSKNSSVWWMQGGGFHPEIWFDFTFEIWQISPRFHLWNPPKIIKASVLAKTLQFDECRVGAMTKDFQMKFTLKSGGFYPWNLADFTQISPVKSSQNYKSKCFSKNSSVWWMQGGDFTLKSGGFHLWNLADFTQISPVKSSQNYKSKCFSKNSSVWWMQGGGCDQGFHEICQISHEIHMKSTRFHEIHWISKLWAFAWWSSIGLSFFKRPIRRVFAETSDFIRFGVVSAKTLQFGGGAWRGLWPQISWNPRS